MTYQSKFPTALEAIAQISEKYKALPEDVNVQCTMGFIESVALILEDWSMGVAESKIQVQALSEEQAKDKTLNAIGIKYGITLNQVVAYMDMCEQINREQLEGTGMVVVPFWFHEQYIEQKRQHQSLIDETTNLMASLSKVQSSKLQDLGIEMPKRESIITGVTQPYVPGVTGPRAGDEHLDLDNNYSINDLRRGGFKP